MTLIKTIASRGILGLLVLLAIPVHAASPKSGESPNSKPSGQSSAAESILLTVFLRHDQGKSLEEINEILDRQKFWQNFPPEGTRVVSWHVLMGIGQVVTLEVPPGHLRSVNVAIEKHGWKAFRSEFYATYDLYPIIASKLKNQARALLKGAETQ